MIPVTVECIVEQRGERNNIFYDTPFSEKIDNSKEQERFVRCRVSRVRWILIAVLVFAQAAETLSVEVQLRLGHRFFNIKCAPSENGAVSLVSISYLFKIVSHRWGIQASAESVSSSSAFASSSMFCSNTYRRMVL